jgi:hypothetical protein
MQPSAPTTHLAQQVEALFYVRQIQQGCLPGSLLAGPFNDEQTARQHQQNHSKAGVFREALI